MISSSFRFSCVTMLLIAAGVVGVGVLLLTYVVFEPIVMARTIQPPEEHKAILPPYDARQFHELPVQHRGRQKPFQSAAIETVREICGASKFEGKDPVALVLAWILSEGRSLGPGFTDWESYAFVLCNHQGLRKVVYAHLTDADRKALSKEEQDLLQHGKYIAPAELRKSPGFQRLLEETNAIRTKDPEGGHRSFNEEQRTAEEVLGRLMLFDHICGRAYTDLLTKSHISGRLVGREGAGLMEGNLSQHPDPFQFVGLDQVPGGAWFSFGDLRIVQKTPARWVDFMQERLATMPQLYISPERQLELKKFQQQLTDGKGSVAMKALEDELTQRRQDKVKGLKEALDTYGVDRAKSIADLYRKVKSHRHISAEMLRDVQKEYDAGRGEVAVAELRKMADKLTLPPGDELIDAFSSLDRKREVELAVLEKAATRILTQDEMKEFGKVFEAAHQRRLVDDARLAAIAADMDAHLKQVDDELVSSMRKRVDYARRFGYHSEDQRFRMLHINYLEARFPDLYKESIHSQKCPIDNIDDALTAYDRLKVAYRSKDAQQFDVAAKDFFAVLRRISDASLAEGLARQNADKPAVKAAFAKVEEAQQAGDADAEAKATEAFFGDARSAGINFNRYPGISTLGLELTYNRVQPFMWAWVIMLPAILFFAISLSMRWLGAQEPTGAGKWIALTCYVLGFVFYFGSVTFQIFGFYARVRISGWAPVTNMYETVIWVAFMSGIFALILELFYRRRIIALAGCLVAVIGLVLADQLPTSLDPKLAPLVPVLRSNFWLTIHVLTIVSSYAAGTLAWGLGNIVLFLLAFTRPKRELLRMLSQYIYGAMAIAVLLLATGTFLGGWWAAYSWGRFWGWDPKETWALISLIVYVVPLHFRFLPSIAGWVKDFVLAVSSVVCYAAIVMCWYGVNFVLGAGLHSYGFGGGGQSWVFWAGLLNIEFVILASIIYLMRLPLISATTPRSLESLAAHERPAETAITAGVGGA